MPRVYKFTIVVLLSVLIWRCECARTASEQSRYTTPQPKIEVFTPRGFRVSIEDTLGLRLFAFHANINKNLSEFDPGRYSKEALHPQNGRWVVEDKQARLRIGDKFYYWVFIIKDNLGYRLDGQCFIVDELLPVPDVSIPSRPPSSFNTELPYFIDGTNPPMRNPSVEYTTVTSEASKDLYLCEETILNTTQVLIALRLESDKLKQLNKQLIMALNEYPGSKQMKLIGRIPPDGTPLSVLQFILREKLDLKSKIVWAVREGTNAIAFEVPSVADKYELILAAKDKLKNTKFEIS